LAAPSVPVKVEILAAIFGGDLRGAIGGVTINDDDFVGPLHGSRQRGRFSPRCGDDDDR